MMEVGRVKVRVVTWRKSTTMIRNQTQGPLAWPGGGIVDGGQRYVWCQGVGEGEKRQGVLVALGCA
jgi:alpha-L-arabinofuranosidase